MPQVKVSFRAVELGGKSSSGSAKKSNKHRRVWSTVAVLLFVVLAITFVWRSLSSPGHGNIAVLAEDTSNNSALPEYTTLTTNFYSLNYSGRYSQQPTDIPPAGVLDYKVLAFKLGGQPGQSKIEVLVKSAPYGGIVLDSAYDYYAKHQDRFKMSNEFYHGEAIDIARSTKGPPEAAGMWLHDGFLLIAKITTPDKVQNIDDELKDLLSSVQWRQN